MKKEQIERANAILQEIDSLKQNLIPLGAYIIRTELHPASVKLVIQYKDSDNYWRDKAYTHSLFDMVINAMIDEIEGEIKKLEMELELL